MRHIDASSLVCSVSDIASSYDIAYCLTLLSYTDKPVKKLVERFKLYQNLLIHNEIYECFLATIAKMKKTARVELRSIVDELEAKIEAWHSAEVQEDGQLYAASADIAISSGASAVAATPATASSSSSSVASSSSSSKKAPSTRGRRGAAAAAKPKAKAPATRKSTRATSTRGVRCVSLYCRVPHTCCLLFLVSCWLVGWLVNSARPSNTIRQTTRRRMPARMATTATLICLCNMHLREDTPFAVTVPQCRLYITIGWIDR